MRGVLDEWVHEPELKSLDILCLKVGIFQFAHNTAPAAQGVSQQAVGSDTGTVGRRGNVIVVRAAFLWIVGQVELVDICGLSGGKVFVGEHFLLIYPTGIGAREVVGRDVRRAATVTVEVIADTIPGYLGSVEAVGMPGPGCRLGEHGQRRAVVLRRTGQEPRVDALEVYAALGSLEVVHIADATLLRASAAHAGYEVCEFGSEAHRTRRLGVDAGQHVDELGDERHLMAIVQVEAPDGVARGLVAKVVLLRHRLLAQVHHCGTQVEVGLELIVQVQTHHALGTHAEAVVLTAHADGGVR